MSTAQPPLRTPQTAHSAAERRTAPEPTPAIAGRTRYFDSRLDSWVVKVPPGDHYVTTDPEERVATTLRSCVAACIRDPATGAGGLNHFLLPGDPRDLEESGANAGMRYGQNAMERLVNDVLRHGGRKDRLEVKIFGGGRLMGLANGYRRPEHRLRPPLPGV